MKQSALALFLLILALPVQGQTFPNGFNFYLPPYDTTSQVFLPSFPIEPIGTNDFVTANADGNFEVNGKQLRIYGNNVYAGPALFPDKDKAPFLAGRLRKYGFNIVRFGNEFNGDWGLRTFDGANLTYNEERLDKFFFFVNELKKQGIRVVLAWNGEIRQMPEEGIAVSDSVPMSHALCDYYDRPLINIRKKYIKDFLNKENPYTGLALKNDPVLGLMEVVNEDWLFHSYIANGLKPISEGGVLPTYYSIELDSLWNQYLIGKYGTDEGLKTAWKIEGTSSAELLAGESLTLRNIKRLQKTDSFGGKRRLDEVAFYIDLEEKYFDEFYSFLKTDCGLRIPISGQNFLAGVPDNKIQSRLDYVDEHTYWDLSQVDADRHLINTNKPMVNDPRNSTILQLFRGLAYKNKPFSIGEYNHPYFTDYSVESPFYVTAYSSLHDADAIMFFSFGSGQSIENDVVENDLDFVRNNIRMAFAPTFAKAFRDKLISGSTQPIELSMTNNDVLSAPFTTREWWLYPTGYPTLQALNHKIVVADYNGTVPLLNTSIPSVPTNPYISDTKELVWDATGLFTINTPKFRAAVGFLQNYPNQEIGNIKLISGNVFGGFSWISLTDDSLYSATKSLLTIGTKQENTGTVWNSTKTTVLNIGTAPTIIQPALITFELKLKADSVRIHELGTMGERTGRFTIYHPIAANTFRITFDQTVTKTLWFGVETAWATDTHTLHLLTMPDSSASVYGKDIFRIEWQGEFVSRVKLELSINNGRTWLSIADSIDNSIGHYDWTVPDVNADFCLIRITDCNASGVSDANSIPFHIEKYARKNIIVNGDFANGMSDWMTNVNSSASASFAVSSGVLSVTIQNGGTAGWHVQLFQFGKNLVKGKTYDISIDASADQTRTIDVGVSQNGGSYTQYGSNTFSITPTMKTYSFSFIMNNTTDAQSQFVIGVGNSTVGVKLDNIGLHEHDFSKSVSLTSPLHCDTLVTGSTWVIQWTSQNVTSCNLFYKTWSAATWNSIATGVTASAGMYPWNVPSLANDSCLIKIEDVSDATVSAISELFPLRNVSSWIVLTKPNGGEQYYGKDTTRIEWITESVAKLRLQLSTTNGRSWILIADSVNASTGGYSWILPEINADTCLVRLADITTAAVADTSNSPFAIARSIRKNMLTNGDFTSDLSGWSTNVVSPASASFSVSNGTLGINIGNGGTATWHIQIYQFGKNIVKGKTYDIFVDASADQTKNIDVSVSQNGGSYTLYGSNTFNITPTMKTYSFNFIMNNTTDAQAQFVVGVGNSTVAMKLDNIVMHEHDFGTPVVRKSEVLPSRYSLLQNYPNPFNPTTTISFALPKKSIVSLKIYDVIGKEVATVVNTQLESGYYSYVWNATSIPSGMYFYRLQAGSFTETKKLVLLR